MQDAIIYIGCSYPQIESILALQNAGFYVVGTDRSNDAAARDKVNEFHQIDATDIDSFVALATELSGRLNLIFAYGVADYCFAAVSAIHRIIGNESLCTDYECFVSKPAAKRYFAAVKIQFPELLASGRNSTQLLQDWLSSENSGSGYLKVDGLNNSRGICLVEKLTVKNIKKALENIRYLGGAVFIERTCINYEHIINVDGVVIDGIYHAVSVTNRIIDAKDSRLNLALVQPSFDVPEAIQNNLHTKVSRLIEAMGYRFGPITVDFIGGQNEEYVALEVSPHFHFIGGTILSGMSSPLVAMAQFLAGQKTWHETLKSHNMGQRVICHLLYDDADEERHYFKLLKKMIDRADTIDWCVVGGNRSEAGQCKVILWQKTKNREDIMHYSNSAAALLSAS